MWWIPGPRFATKRAIGEAGSSASSSSTRDSPAVNPTMLAPSGIIESDLGQTQHVPEERNAPCEGLDCDPDVRYSGAAWG